MKPAERAAASVRARRSYQLLTEHQAPTRQDLGEARDRLNDCHNLPTRDQVWDAVHQLETTAAEIYGAPHTDQARLEGMPHPRQGTVKRPDDRDAAGHQKQTGELHRASPPGLWI